MHTSQSSSTRWLEPKHPEIFRRQSVEEMDDLQFASCIWKACGCCSESSLGAAEVSALQAPCIRHMLTIAKLCLVLSNPLVLASLVGVVAMQATELILRQRWAFHITLVLVSQWNARQTPVVIICLWDVVAYRDMQETSRPQRRQSPPLFLWATRENR